MKSLSLHFNSIKSILITMTFAVVLAFVSLLIWNYNSIGIFSYDAMEENLSARQEWELMMLADPKTGKIPKNYRKDELAFVSSLNPNFATKNASLLSSGSFQARGPWNIGGRTRAVVIDIKDENVIMAAGVSGGIWKSIDAGATWTRKTPLNLANNVIAITQDERAGKEHIWYAGTGEIWGNSSDLNGDGMLKSTDYGETWFALASTANGTPQTWTHQYEFIWNIAADKSNLDKDEIYMATALGAVYRSDDGGEKWSKSIGGWGNNYSIFTDVAVTSTGVVYATLSAATNVNVYNSAIKGIFRSTDGVNWTDITPSFFPAKAQRITIGISTSDENQVYFLAHTPESGKESIDWQGKSEWNSLWKYTYISGDGKGNNGNWENRSENVPQFGGAFGNFFSQGSYNLVVKVHPTNPNIVVIGGTNLYCSTDGFSSSENSTWVAGYEPGSSLPDYGVYPNNHPDQHALAFYKSNPNKLIVGNDGGLFRTNDITSKNVVWESINNGYITTQYYTVAIPQIPKSKVIIGGLQDNGTLFTNSEDVKSSWEMPGLGDGSFCAIANDGSYYMSRQQGRIGRFILDEKGQIIQKGRVDPAGLTRDDYLFINPFVLDANDNKIMYVAGNNRVWRNNNLLEIPLGKWDSTSINWDELQFTEIPGGKISALATSKNPSNRLYYGTSLGKLYYLENANTSNEQSIEITGSNFPAGFINCIAVDSTDANKLFVVFSNYNVLSVFYSENAGKTWTAVSGNLEDFNTGGGKGPSCRWLSMMPVNGKMMYFLGTSTGLYSTAFINGMSTVWKQESPELIGNNVVTMLAVRPSDNLLVVATHGAGVYSAIINTLPSLPEQVSLISPLNKSQSILSEQMLTWNALSGLNLYELQVAEDINFTQNVRTFSGLKSNEYAINNIAQGLKDYYWRVRAINSAAYGEYSETWKFTSAITSPILIFPSPAATDIVRKPVLTWASVNGAIKYRLQVAQGFLVNNPFLNDSNVTDTTYQMPELKANTKYAWRVSAYSEFGEGVISNHQTFNTGINMSVLIPVAESIKLYPQPAKDYINLQFYSKNAKNMNISVVDALGFEVYQTGIFTNVGTNLHSFNISNFTNGMYIIKLDDGLNSKAFNLSKTTKLKEQMKFSNAISNFRTPFKQNYFLISFIVIFLSLWTYTFVETIDLANWILENILVFLFGLFLVFTYKKHQFSDLTYLLVTVYLCLHVYGSMNSYAENPFGYWLQEVFQTSRNHYDRIVHFSFGFLLAYPMRELFLSWLKFPSWVAWLLPIEITLSISGLYELVEWAVADIFFQAQGAAYLGTQGDVWDAQKDMFLATLGAILATSIISTVKKAMKIH